eukprot:7391713-Prymnesium_polylepis.2
MVGPTVRDVRHTWLPNRTYGTIDRGHEENRHLGPTHHFLAPPARFWAVFKKNSTRKSPKSPFLSPDLHFFIERFLMRRFLNARD